MTIIYIGLAGAAGALLRFVLSLAFNPVSPGTVPWGTLLCNLAGCLLIGKLAYMPGLRRLPRLRAALTTGFIGGFTTFSALSWELFTLLRQGQLLYGLIYFSLSFVGGLACIQAGRLLNSHVPKRSSTE